MSIMKLKNTATGVWEAVPSIVGPAGPSGYSPTVTVTDITGGHRVTITDADGPVYRCTIDNNVWAPDAYPAGWEVVE